MRQNGLHGAICVWLHETMCVWLHEGVTGAFSSGTFSCRRDQRRTMLDVYSCNAHRASVGARERIPVAFALPLSQHARPEERLCLRFGFYPLVTYSRGRRCTVSGLSIFYWRL